MAISPRFHPSSLELLPGEVVRPPLRLLERTVRSRASDGAASVAVAAHRASPQAPRAGWLRRLTLVATGVWGA